MRIEDHRVLPASDFRSARTYLADHVFLNVPGGGVAPDDPIDKDAWESLMHLPTDVLLRTTDYQGRMLADTHDQYASWVHASPMQPSDSAFMFEPAMDAGDEFHASPFIAAHGWYRQATAALRNALEGMTCAAAFAARNDIQHYSDWRAGVHEPKFGNAVDMLGQRPNLAAIDQNLGAPGLFGRKPPGVLRELYANLCRYAHSKPGHTNPDIWQSNGPVWVGRGFTQFWIDYCDTIAACFVLLKIGWPALALPPDVRPLFGATGPRWHGLGQAVEGEFFGL